MNQAICPFDGNPCEADCPIRYRDTPEGGCYLTTAQEMGAEVLPLLLFVPGKEDTNEIR